MAHRTYQEIIQELTQLPVTSGQRYQHYKTKSIYVVDKLVVLEATDQVAVAYYDEHYPDLTWIRPYTDFTALIDDKTPRFSLLT